MKRTNVVQRMLSGMPVNPDDEKRAACEEDAVPSRFRNEIVGRVICRRIESGRSTAGRRLMESPGMNSKKDWARALRRPTDLPPGFALDALMDDAEKRGEGANWMPFA